MDVPFIGVSAISFCLPGLWLCLGAVCTALAHLHFVHLHSLWFVEIAFVTGLILCATGLLGGFGGTRRSLWPISVFVGSAFAVLSIEAATAVVFVCQWNLVEETAKEHDQTGALLLVLRCIEAHPIIISWLVGSFFILQVATLFLAAHHAFDIVMDTEEPEEDSRDEEGGVPDAKAPLLLAYEQAYLPKPSKPSGQTPNEEQQPCGHQKEPGSRCRVPEWRDVLLTAALIWLAATGLVLVIAMVKVGMYQDPGLGHHSGSSKDGTRHAVMGASLAPLPAPHAGPLGVNSLAPSALHSLVFHPDSKDQDKDAHEHHSAHGKHGSKKDDDREDGDEDDDDDESDEEEDSHHHTKEKHSREKDDEKDSHHQMKEKHTHESDDEHSQHRKQKKLKPAKSFDSDDEDDKDDDEEDDHTDRRARGGHENSKGEDGEGEEGEGSEEAGELGKKPWKKHHHHKHRKHRKHCEEEGEEPSCQAGAPRWFAGVLGAVGMPLMVLSSVAAAGVWCGIPAVLHMFAGASAVFLASEALLVHMCFAHGPILVTAAEFDNSNGLQHTLDFVAEHNMATPLLVIALLACQAGAMVAAANFGMPIPVTARVATASAQLRRKVQELGLPQKGAVLYQQARKKSITAAASLRSAAGRATERAGFPAAAARLAGSCPAAAAAPADAETAGRYSPIAASAAEEAASPDGSVKDDSSDISDSKDPWASLRRALVPEGTERTVRWSDED